MEKRYDTPSTSREVDIATVNGGKFVAFYKDSRWQYMTGNRKIRDVEAEVMYWVDFSPARRARFDADERARIAYEPERIREIKEAEKRANRVFEDMKIEELNEKKFDETVIKTLNYLKSLQG